MLLRYGINRKTAKRKYGRRGIEHRSRELEIIDDATGGEIMEAITKANPGWNVTGFALPESYHMVNFNKWRHCDTAQRQANRQYPLPRAGA